LRTWSTLQGVEIPKAKVAVDSISTSSQRQQSATVGSDRVGDSDPQTAFDDSSRDIVRWPGPGQVRRP